MNKGCRRHSGGWGSPPHKHTHSQTPSCPSGTSQQDVAISSKEEETQPGEEVADDEDGARLTSPARAEGGGCSGRCGWLFWAPLGGCNATGGLAGSSGAVAQTRPQQHPLTTLPPQVQRQELHHPGLAPPGGNRVWQEVSGIWGHVGGQEACAKTQAAATVGGATQDGVAHGARRAHPKRWLGGWPTPKSDASLQGHPLAAHCLSSPQPHGSTSKGHMRNGWRKITEWVTDSWRRPQPTTRRSCTLEEMTKAASWRQWKPLGRRRGCHGRTSPTYTYRPLMS